MFRYQIDSELVDQIRAATYSGFVLGSERFKQEKAAMVGRRTWRGSPGRPAKLEEMKGGSNLLCERSACLRLRRANL